MDKHVLVFVTRGRNSANGRCEFVGGSWVSPRSGRLEGFPASICYLFEYMIYFPLLVSKGIHHYRKDLYFFKGAS